MVKNECINSPVQGAAFHVNLKSFILLDKAMREEGWDSRLIGQIHDSIVIDVNPEELDHVVKTARRITCEDVPKAWKWINVPLDIEAEISPVDGSWAEKEKMD
jgi:DNA polymerase I-like protein with 3'-5' exonuclease and polymerase domains